MAENSRRIKSPGELSEEIQWSRQRVAQGLCDLRAELDFPGKIRRSVRRQPVLWIGVATAIGLVLTFRFGRKKKNVGSRKKEEKTGSRLLEAGFILGLVRIVANLCKPIIVRFVADKVERYAGKEQAGKRW
jgi:hypothetical protein